MSKMHSFQRDIPSNRGYMEPVLNRPLQVTITIIHKPNSSIFTTSTNCTMVIIYGRIPFTKKQPILHHKSTAFALEASYFICIREKFDVNNENYSIYLSVISTYLK